MEQLPQQETLAAAVVARPTVTVVMAVMLQTTVELWQAEVDGEALVDQRRPAQVLLAQVEAGYMREVMPLPLLAAAAAAQCHRVLPAEVFVAVSAALVICEAAPLELTTGPQLSSRQAMAHLPSTMVYWILPINDFLEGVGEEPTGLTLP